MDIHVHICYILITLWILNTQSQERNRYERKTIKKRKDFEGFLIIFFFRCSSRDQQKREHCSGHFVKYKKRTKETM